MTNEQKIRLEAYRNMNFEDMPEKQQDEFITLEAQEAHELNLSILDDIELEAFDRVWYDRSNTDDEKIAAVALEVKERYNIDDDTIDDFYHGYWTGILALSRFLSGYYGTDKNILDLNYDTELDDCGIFDT